jgi:hypothetical protein
MLNLPPFQKKTLRGARVTLHLDGGRQRAPKYGHLGNLAVRVEQDVVHPVDRHVFDLQPEECGVVGLAAEDLLVGEVRRHRGDALDGCRDGLAAGERLIAEGLISTTFSARTRARASLSAPPCMQSTKDSTVARCWANVVMATPRCV